MKALIILGCLFVGNLQVADIKKTDNTKILTVAKPVTSNITPLSITFPKNNQKVRGDYKIYGKAKAGAIVKLHVTSTYYKTAHDNQERIFKGEGPINRMNRKFTLTADRNGNWVLKNINLQNAGWEESFTIKATSDDRTVTVKVIDDKHPINID